VSDYCDSRTQGAAPPRVHGCRLGEASRHARWQTILAAVKANRMDSVMVRKCIAVAMLSPDISAEDVLAHVMKDADSSAEPDQHERANMVPLFEKAS
jgi:hypothetical protein